MFKWSVLWVDSGEITESDPKYAYSHTARFGARHHIEEKLAFSRVTRSDPVILKLFNPNGSVLKEYPYMTVDELLKLL